MHIIRQEGLYSLVQKKDKFYIDNGLDDVSEYMDAYQVYPLYSYSSEEFIEFCLVLFS